MKVSISFKPEEARAADAIIQLVKALHQDIKIHAAPVKGEYCHTYIKISK